MAMSAERFTRKPLSEQLSMFEGKQVDTYETSINMRNALISTVPVEEGTMVAFIVTGKVTGVSHDRDGKHRILVREQVIGAERAHGIPYVEGLRLIAAADEEDERSRGVVQLFKPDAESSAPPPGAKATSNRHFAETTPGFYYDAFADNLTELPSEAHDDDEEDEVKESKTFSTVRATGEILDDDLYARARRVVITEQIGSVNELKKKLGVGHARAAQLMELLETDHIVGPARPTQGREVLKSKWED